ncbi:MAG: hypothetical protein AB1465_01490 [Patescibacteria group bacterium]
MGQIILKTNLNPISAQTKIKARTKLIIGIILGVAVLAGIGGALYFGGVITPQERPYKIDLSSAFSDLNKDSSDPYMVYNTESRTEPAGLRLAIQKFVNQVDNPEDNPFSGAQGVFPVCDKLKYENELFKIDSSEVFLSSTDNSKNKDEISKNVTFDFTNPEKNKVYTKIKILLKGKVFEEMAKQIIEGGRQMQVQEAVKKIIEEELLQDPKLSEEQKKQYEAYLTKISVNIDENIFEQEQKQELEKLKKEGMPLYLPFEKIVSNHLIELIEVRYQYDPRYFIIRNGQIFPLAPTSTDGASLKAKICDGASSQEIKIIIPQNNFENFKSQKPAGQSPSGQPQNKYGVYDTGFLIGKAQSQPILQEEINKILEKNYITGAKLEVKTFHHKDAKGEMEIYLSPDGGKTWITAEEWQNPKITPPEKKENQDYTAKKDIFTYNFKKEIEPKDLRMIAVAQNKSETGVGEENTQWKNNLETIKDKSYELQKEVPSDKAANFVFQRTLFLLPNDEKEIKINNSPLSDFNLISKYGDQEMKKQNTKIKTGSTPFYTQISFTESASPALSTPIPLPTPSAPTLTPISPAEIKDIIQKIKNQTKKIIDENNLVLDKSETGEFFTDPAPIDQKIAILEQETVRLQQAEAKDLEKSQIDNLAAEIQNLKKDFATRRTLDGSTLETLNKINRSINSIEAALQDQQNFSSPTSFNFNLISQAKAQVIDKQPSSGVSPGIGPSILQPTQFSSSSPSLIFSAVVLPYSTPVLSEAEISFATEPKPTPKPEEPLDISSFVWHRGPTRLVLKWNFTQGAQNNLDPKDISFKYGENKNSINKGAKVYKDKNDGKYYVVLRDLKGGEWSDKNDQGFEKGRFPYYYQVSVANKITEPKIFKTLNRMQTIGYYYTLVLDRDYLKNQDETNLKKWETPDSEFAGKKVKDLEKGGPGFFYKPEGKESLTLPGIKFTMINDRMMKEFDNKLLALQKEKETKEAISMLYRVIHDRIYNEDLGKFYDQKGLEYWVSRTDSKITGKDAIDIFGVKFALSVSKEYQDELISAIGAAEAKPELAYQIVLKRGADKAGAKYFGASFALAKDMRKHLAESEEYTNRLKEIEKEFGRSSAISEMYETLYGRAPDVKGVEYWDKTGSSFDILMQKFLSSDEFVKVLKD